MTNTLPLPSRCVRRLKGHVGAVNKVYFNGNGQYAISCGADKTVRLWNPHREASPGLGFEIKAYSGPHGYEVLDVCIAQDNSRFGSCGGDKSAFVWDIPTGQVLRKYFGHEYRINSVAFNSLDDSVMVTGSYDRTVRVWDCKSQSRTPIQVLPHFRDSVSSVLCTADEIVACSVDGTVRLFDIRAGKVRCNDLGKECPVASVALSYDGNCLLTNCLGIKSATRQVRSSMHLLDKASGQVLNSFRGHVNDSYSMSSCFDNTDAYVLCGSEDGFVYGWDLVTGQIVHTLREHQRPVSSVSYHPDNVMMMTSSHDSTIAVWQ